MPAIFTIVKGSNPPLEIQLYPASSDLVTNGLDLTQMASVTGRAQLQGGAGPAIMINTVRILSPLTKGKVRIEFAQNTFPEVGVYVIHLVFLDNSGRKYVFPSDGTSLKVKVTSSI